MEDLKNVIDESGSAGGCGVDQYRRLAALLATTHQPVGSCTSPEEASSSMTWVKTEFPLVSDEGRVYKEEIISCQTGHIIDLIWRL